MSRDLIWSQKTLELALASVRLMFEARGSELRARVLELEDELERHQKAADDSQQFFSERQKDAYLRGAEAALRWAVSQDGERYMEQVNSYIQRGLKAVCGETNNNQGEAK